jgi:hypothetical protein
MESIKSEIAATAARMVVEEGLEYGPAKRRAAKQLGAGARVELPANNELEEAVREYILLFCAETQPQELAALRRLALFWMERLQAFRPYLTGAVWQGTATRLSDVHLQLFCDDSKSAEIALIDHKIKYDVGTMNGFQGKPVDTLHISATCAELGEQVGVHLAIFDHDDLRGALKPDARGRAPRGDIQAVRTLAKAGT